MDQLTEHQRMELDRWINRAAELRGLLARIGPDCPERPDRARQRARLGSMLAHCEERIMHIQQMSLFKDKPTA